LYQLNSKLWLTFLARIEPEEQYCDAQNAFKFVKSLEKEWI
jgi:hypothetical protein